MSQPFTTLLAIDNSQDWNVVAQSYCRRVTVQENYNSQHPPTVDLLQKAPATGTAVRIAQGTPAIYTAPPGGFKPGDIAGTIKVDPVGGITSCTVQQIESQTI